MIPVNAEAKGKPKQLEDNKCGEKTQANQILPYIKIIIHQKQVESSLASSLENKACFQATGFTMLSVFSCYHEK